ncbi:MAG TPA: imidazole glycerol phosphate synthase subunit HisH [Solirubrobacteraceae bacterium]|jgi:glutamine amidotransferase|nr:imidazole glycerol phosphate synthase subunit HisH [Solirubrobacteraceae bacterium]
MTPNSASAASAASSANPAAPSIAVVDYGMGNRRSVEKALQRVGAHAYVTRDHHQLRAADGLLLPGVGAFPAAMATIHELGLGELLRERAAAGVPLFGSCMGMQLLFERSEEHGGADGLGLLRGEVRRLNSGAAQAGAMGIAPGQVAAGAPAGEPQAPPLKLPHIGWSEVRWRRRTPLNEGLPDPAYLYHVHSFVAYPADPEVVIGTAEYGEVFPAVVESENIFGAQSHPEKSSTHGLQLLRNFVAICAAAAGAHLRLAS